MPPKAHRATRKQSLEMDAQKNQGNEKGEIPKDEIANEEDITKSTKTKRSKEATSKGQDDEGDEEEPSSSIRETASEVNATIINAKRSKEEGPTSSSPELGFETNQDREEEGPNSSMSLRSLSNKSISEVEIQPPRAHGTK